MAEGFLGVDFLVKLSGGEVDPTPETWATIGGMRSTGGSINNEMIDVTNKDNMPWRTQIEGGIKSMSLTLGGVFNNQATLRTAMELAMSGLIKRYQLVTGNGDTYEGSFKITKCDRTGEHSGEETYSLSLESSGEVVFTPDT